MLKHDQKKTITTVFKRQYLAGQELIKKLYRKIINIITLS